MGFFSLFYFIIITFFFKQGMLLGTGGGKKLSTKGRVLRPYAVLPPTPPPGPFGRSSPFWRWALTLASDSDSLRSKLSGLVLRSPAESSGNRRGRSGHPGQDALGGRRTLEGRLPRRGRRTGEGAPSRRPGLPPPLPAPAADPTRLLREIC